MIAGFELVFTKTKKKVSFSLYELRLLIQACQYLYIRDYELGRKKELGKIMKKFNLVQGWEK